MFKQDEAETPVLFRKWSDGDVVALFPTIPGTVNDPGSCSSYQHVGQHGAAALCGLIANTKPASEADYTDLKKELESAPYGYRLKVYAHNQRRFTIERLRELRRHAA